MNYNETLIEFIKGCPYDEPIFIEDIKKYFLNIIKDNFEVTFKNIYVYINRLVKDNILVQFIKGVYYKPINGTFGPKPLNADKVIKKKYICDDDGHKGYISGASLFNAFGLTTQVSSKIIIVTNECPNANLYTNHQLDVTIKKPKIEITEENYKYLQLFDVLINKDNIPIEVDNEKEIIYNYIKENELEFEKLFEYANKINNLKPIMKLYDLCEVNE